MVSYMVLKRVLDFILAFILLILFAPLMTIVAFAIKLDSKGPVLFKQNRPGKGTRIFRVYKFRTMRTEVEINGRKLSDLERMTKLGSFLRKTSIDELPQLFNVLKGEMSFIGPRPLLIEYLDRYTPEQLRRHEVTPGISGWAQVNGRNSISWEDKFKLDVWYIDNMNFALDFKICMLTIMNVIFKKDINNSSANTMPIFMGNKHNIEA